MGIIYTLHFFPISKLKRKRSGFLRGHKSVKATLNFCKTPQMIFLTCPAISKTWSDKIPRGLWSIPNITWTATRYSGSCWSHVKTKYILTDKRKVPLWKLSCMWLLFNIICSHKWTQINFKLHIVTLALTYGGDGNAHSHSEDHTLHLNFKL